jgi:RecB family exonuclease
VNLKLGDDRFWVPFKKRQIAVARQFLKVEAEWKKRFSALQLLPSESEWKLWFDATTGSFAGVEAPGRILIRGRIDRLETDGQGNYVVVDYKAGSKMPDQASWIKDNDLQLLFYMWALEKGALNGLQGHVIGAFYYTYKDFSRNRGLQVEGTEGRLFPAVSAQRKNITVTLAEKLSLFEKLEEILREVIRRTALGDWGSGPRDEKICQLCQWSGTCRAPHLN